MVLLTITAVMLVMAGPAPASGQESDTPGRPTNLTGTVEHDAVKLTWDAPDGSTVTGYQVLRLDRAIHALGDFQVHVADTGTADTAYTDTDVEAEARYVYRVKARNGNALSGVSNYFDADLSVPAMPTGLTGTVSHDHVALSWDDPQDGTITGYQILRRDRSKHAAGTFEIHVDDTGSADTSYTDTDVEVGAEYVYRIKARNSVGLSSRSSYFDANVSQPPAVTVSFEQATYTVSEGESVVVAVVLDTDPKRNVTIEIVPANQDGASDTDYSGVPQEVVFTSGETRKEFTVTAADDSEDDDGESVKLSFRSLPDRVSSGAIDETTVNITDNDSAPADPDATRDGAIDLGDITAVTRTRYPTYSLNQDGDAIDYFRFTITESRFVTIGVRQLDANASITLENSNGETILHKSAPGEEHVMIYVTRQEGAYYLKVEADEEGENEYRLAYGTRASNANRVAQETRETARNLGDITNLRSTRSRDGTVNKTGDAIDYYKFTLQESKKITVELEDLDVDAGLYLEDTRGRRLKIRDSSWTSIRWLEISLEKGTYYVRVESVEDGANSYTMRYRVEGQRDDYPRGSNTTGSLTLNKSSKGKVDFTGDRDWFSAELVAGKTYWVEHKGSPIGNGTLTNTAITGIFDSEGTVVRWTRDDDSGVGYNARVVFVPTSTGTYYIEASAYKRIDWDGTSVGPGAQGTYTLFLSERTSGENDDHSNFTDTTGEISAGSSVNGNIESVGDQDWFAMDLTAGSAYRIAITGAFQSSGEFTLGYGKLYGIYDAGGNAVSGHVDEEGAMTWEFRPDGSGKYFVSIGGNDLWILGDNQQDYDNYHANLSSTYRYFTTIGTYKLEVTEVVD